MATVDSLKGQLQTSGNNKPQTPNTLQSMTSNPKIIERFTGVLGDEKKANAFLSSVLSLSIENPQLSKCNPNGVINATLLCATLGLPIQKSLGMAYLIPYGGNCTVQLGTAGLIRLALNSGQVKKLTATCLFEGQLKSWNPITEEIEFDFENKQSDVIIGCIGRIELINGFIKQIYMSKEKLQKHKEKYSKGNKLWNTEEEKMYEKTILKKLIRFSPISFDIISAVNFDGSVVNNVDTSDISNSNVEYIDIDSNVDGELDL